LRRKGNNKTMSNAYMKYLWGQIAEEEEEGGVETLAVDPIPTNIIGKVQHEKLAGGSFLWLIFATAILGQPDIAGLLWDYREAARPRAAATDSMWAEQLQSLCGKDGLFIDETVQRARVHHWARFFLVKKKEKVGRVILNCRQANNHCKELPSVNFPRMGDLLRRIDEISRGKGLWAFEMDLRHAFFQVPIKEHLGRHFMVKCAASGRILRPRALPMGWKASPFIQQSILWGAILKDIPEYLGAKVLEDTKLGESPPAWVEICSKDGEVVGLVTAYLDNVLVMSCDEDVVKNHAGSWVRNGCRGRKTRLGMPQ